MWPVVVVVIAVILKQYLRLLQIDEHLPLQQLLSRMRLMKVSLSRRSPTERQALCRASSLRRWSEPFLERLCDELGAVIRANVVWLTPLDEQPTSSVSMTPQALIERCPSSERHSLVYSSTTGITFNLRPSSVESIAKS
jgi:hypothetical protein